MICAGAFMAHAQDNLPDLRGQLANARTDSQKLAVYRHIYDVCYGKPNDSVKPYMEQGLALFTASGYKHGQGEMLLLLSNIYNERGQVALAKEKAEEALKIFTGLNEEHDMAKANNSIANAWRYLGNYQEAIAHSLAALKNFEHLKDTADLINTYLELGAANDMHGDNDKAQIYYHQALDLSLRVKENANIIYLYNNIGLSFARKGKFDEALKYFEKAEAISRKPAYIKARMTPLTNLGKIYAAKGDDKKALAYLYEARDLAKELKVQEPLCRILLEIGGIETRKDPKNTASLKEGLATSAGMGFLRLQREFVQALADVADKTGNYKEEAALLKQHAVLTDSLFSIDKAKAIANLQSEYELKRTSRELAALQASQLGNTRKKNIIIGIAVLLAITLVTLMAFYARSRRLNRELSAREGELKKANGVKDRLFSIVGHDLKGPVGSIPALISIFRSPDTTEEEREDILNMMEESSQASLDVLDKLLIWGKQQIRGTTFSPALLDAHAIVNDNVRLLHTAAANKQIVITNNIAPGTRIYADENQIKFIVRNLMSNAVKFTHTGGGVEIYAAQQPGGPVTVSVKDNGTGIPSYKLQQIFEPYNESTSGTANEAGTSIGLMLCREFVTQNGGKIWVDSEQNEGAVFSFTVKGAMDGVESN